MSWRSKLGKTLMGALLAYSLNAWAVTAIWHCSKNPTTKPEQTSQSSGDFFVLAGYSLVEAAIGVSVSDLITIYSGDPVMLGGYHLSACFLEGRSELTQSALNSLGLKSSVSQLLARKSAIVQNHLYAVSNQEQMQACIERHFPAVGYLVNPVENERIVPCF